MDRQQNPPRRQVEVFAGYRPDGTPDTVLQNAPDIRAELIESASGEIGDSERAFLEEFATDLDRIDARREALMVTPAGREALGGVMGHHSLGGDWFDRVAAWSAILDDAESALGRMT